MMNNVLQFTKCANCGACQNICPKNAISVKGDELFYEIEVNQDLCVSCGVCKQICPVNEPQKSQNILNAYSAVNKNKKTVRKSSSGGVFTAIAEYVIKNNGIVFSATYNDDFTEVIFESTDITSLENLRRSKYVESLVGYSFREIRKHLENKRFVLFCGAPCQVAGLQHYLGKTYDNLITCDFSCGGFPSHKIFQAYLKELKEKYNSSLVKEVNFRPKDYGWTIHSIRVKFLKGRVYRGLLSTDPYFHSFIKSGLSKREYCYNCSFSDNHYADFILADFWKYEQITNSARNDKGISLVLTNSEKAERILAIISDTLKLEILNKAEASYNIKKSIVNDEKLQKRQKFLSDFKNSGIFAAAKMQGVLVGTKAKKAFCLARLSQIKNRIKTILVLK